MMSIEKAVVFDIDNTLIDSRDRYYASLRLASNGKKVDSFSSLTDEEREKFWSIFLSPKLLHLDKPIKSSIDELLDRYKKGYKIIILTGRPVSMKEDTIKQLKLFGIPYHELYMRPIEDRNPDYVYKPTQLRRIIDKGYEIVEYHEDSPKTLDVVKEMFPQIAICRHGFGEMFRR